MGRWLWMIVNIRELEVALPYMGRLIRNKNELPGTRCRLPGNTRYRACPALRGYMVQVTGKSNTVTGYQVPVAGEYKLQSLPRFAGLHGASYREKQYSCRVPGAGCPEIQVLVKGY